MALLKMLKHTVDENLDLVTHVKQSKLKISNHPTTSIMYVSHIVTSYHPPPPQTFLFHLCRLIIIKSAKISLSKTCALRVILTRVLIFQKI